ncbi:hypothetical protein F5Y04DRAFT_291687 [Hypomontagnella monticulosa]|nr:hypothetical protein F5Y04DRAFT_291687 [Hypomontagnella monticulosa]
MCLYQNIHAAFHHELLNVNAAEQECHKCDHQVSVDIGEECVLHSCCRVLGRETVIRCPDNTGDDEELCVNALVEVVFVPLVMRDEEPAECNETISEIAPKDEIDSDATEAEPIEMMEFWPEDEPGKVVMVYFDDKVDDNVYDDFFDNVDDTPKDEGQKEIEGEDGLVNKVAGSLRWGKEYLLGQVQ